MAIRAQGRARLALLVLFLGVAVALPAMLHCVPGDKHPDPLAAHHLSLTTPTAADSPTAVRTAAVDHSHADNAVRAALCQGVDGLAAALRGDDELRLLAAFVAALAVATLAVSPYFGLSRDPPRRVTKATSPRSGRVLLTDLCIIRR